MIAVEWHAWLAGWAVLAWLAARAKQHKVEIPAIDWHFTRGQRQRACMCECVAGREEVGGVCIVGVFVCVSIYLL